MVSIQKTYLYGYLFKFKAWSGNVEIQNVFLKPEAIKLSELPIKLIYSSIGNLSLSIPWKNLSTQPLEIILSKVYLVIAPEKKSDWTFQDFKNLQKKT
jgi:vacuolar protein sorting-associated protein 13A/C